MSAAPEPLVIVGAGLAGSASALLLARGGAAPLLLERCAGAAPRICGEFISVEAVQALAALGVDVQALGGQRTRRLRLACGALRIEAALPFEAVGLSRRVLDGALQQQAQAAGARLQRGQRVALLQLPGAPGQHFVLACNGRPPLHTPTLHTPTLLLATGKTDLAPLQRRPRRAPEPLVGWQQHLRLQPAQRQAMGDAVEVALYDGGYAGLQAVDGGLVNLCLLAPRGAPGQGWPAMLQALRQACPLLDERLDGALWPATPPQTIHRVPYGHLHRPGPQDPPGLWRLGDQAAVIPSFTGDGMAIALHSAALAAAELQHGGSAARYHRQLLQDVAAQVQRAHALYRLGTHPLGRGALLVLLRRWPALLGWIARLTRVPPAALRWG